MQKIPLTVLPTPVHAAPAYITTAVPVACADGFYEEEKGEIPFRWMGLAGRLTFAAAPRGRHLELWIHSSFHDLSQTLTATVDGAAQAPRPLLRGWGALSIPIPPGATGVDLAVNRLYPPEHYPGDHRQLAIQVRRPLLHEDAERHRHIEARYVNAVRNVREALDGAVVLSSTPWKLGIDMQGACNIKPACVYCAWDYNKDLEGENVDVPFNLDTLAEYGPFFDNASALINCSIGEPFMMKDIDALLDAFGDRGKLLEVTTNGQILTDTNIRKLLGRNVHLYISLDAATPETYARLRNPQFTRLLDNVRRLVKAKGGRGQLPLVYLVFMPMRANVHEVDAFVALCAELEADLLVLRPLNNSEGVQLKWDRGGYHFDYQKELLPFPELVRISGRVAELCRRAGVPLSDQMGFGGSLAVEFAREFEEGRASVDQGTAVRPAPAPAAAEPRSVVTPPGEARPSPAPVAIPSGPPPSLGEEALPVCTEPWSSLYILRRGVMPCCYGGEPIAKMGEFKEAWNAPLLQDIRRELLKGRFHQYCFDSPDCPIVQKKEQGHHLSAVQEAHLVSRRWLHRMRRARFGWPGTVYRACKRTLRRAVGLPITPA